MPAPTTSLISLKAISRLDRSAIVVSKSATEAVGSVQN